MTVGVFLCVFESTISMKSLAVGTTAIFLKLYADVVEELILIVYLLIFLIKETKLVSMFLRLFHKFQIKTTQTLTCVRQRDVH